MKVAIVSINLQWQSGGTRQILSFAQYLRKHGEEVSVYATEINPEVFPELQEGIDMRVVPSTGTLEWHPKKFGLIRKIIRKLEEDRTKKDTARKIANAMDSDVEIVNCHDFAYQVAYFYKKRNPKARVVWTMNEPPFFNLPKGNFVRDAASKLYNSLKELTEKKFFHAIDFVANLATWEKKWAEARGLNARVIWSGLDFERFYAPVHKPPAKTEPFRLISVGSPNQYRRYEDIVEAVKMLRKEGYDARLTIIAKNIWREDEYCEGLKNLVKKYELKPFITLDFEGVSEEGLLEAYAKSHAFVLTLHAPAPRNGSTWGLVIFESMARGIPVIMCRTAGSAEPLTDGVNVLKIDPYSPRQIADHVKFLVENSKQYEAIARAGQEFTKKNISWERYAKEMLELFRSA